MLLSLCACFCSCVSCSAIFIFTSLFQLVLGRKTSLTFILSPSLPPPLIPSLLLPPSVSLSVLPPTGSASAIGDQKSPQNALHVKALLSLEQ